MSGERKRRRKTLLKLFPYCHWCGAYLVYYKPEPHEPLPWNFATLDHLNSRNQFPQGRPLRGEIVLACRLCNEKRAADEQKALGLEELHRRAGRFGKEEEASRIGK